LKKHKLIAKESLNDYHYYMQKLIAYMVTWTTYGTWLQGDERGYVKEGETLEPNPALEKSNISSLKQQIITLNPLQKITAQNAIIEEAKKINHKIFAIAVCSNHIHLLVEKNQESIETATAIYKSAARKALYQTGIEGKVWTKGFDKRFCFNERELKNRIEYINRHNENEK
jgi:REP element-mobilizing transposase RayT